MIWLVLCLFAYAVGAIPTGYLIGKIKKRDIRQEGSHNIGATNVARSLGKIWGLVILLCDFGKACLFVWLIVPLLLEGELIFWGRVISGVCLLLGNIYPAWLSFKGGKGVATGAGIFLILFPTGLAIAAAVFIVVVLLTRYVSFGSLLSAMSLLIARLLEANSFALEIMALHFFTLAFVTLIIFKHRKNLQRLRQGQETKFYFKNSKTPLKN